MRFTIFAKLVILLLALTVLPLGMLGYMAMKNLDAMGGQASTQAEAMGDLAVQDSTQALNDLGAQVIRQKAEDVAKQIEIYLEARPTMTVAQLQADPAFQAIAVQPVGKTGYTAITDVSTLVCRFHSNPKIADMDLHGLAEKLPGFWSVMSKSQGGVISEGYYDWLEPDGSTKQKYMYIALVDAKTADGVTFSVAATTYIDEFNAPVAATSEAINGRVDTLVQDIATAGDAMRRQTVTFVLVVVFAAILIGFAFARSITQPIRQMTEAGNKIGEGQLDVELLAVKTNDEIKDLETTMQTLVGAIKYLKHESSEKAAASKEPKKRAK